MSRIHFAVRRNPCGPCLLDTAHSPFHASQCITPLCNCQAFIYLTVSLSLSVLAGFNCSALSLACQTLVSLSLSVLAGFNCITFPRTCQTLFISRLLSLANAAHSFAAMDSTVSRFALLVNPFMRRYSLRLQHAGRRSFHSKHLGTTRVYLPNSHPIRFA